MSLESKSKAARLKELLVPGRPLICPGAYDALSAKVIEEAGFSAIQVSGYGVAASLLGIPDIGILSLTQMVEVTRYICKAVSIPVMADGDTGFGNAVNTYYTVQAFEDAGAVGVNLEDQEFPKRCGHMEGKQVIPAEEMAGKIKAAAAARKDPSFVINARTDAGTLYGIDEAIRRGRMYAAAGADMIFLEAPKIAGVEDLKKAVKEIGIPVSIGIVFGGKAPLLTYDQYSEIGVARLSFPVAPISVAIKSLRESLQYLKSNQGYGPTPASYFAEFKQITDLLGLPKVKQMEQEFLPAEEIMAKYGKRPA